jgi:hypothetical protein
VALPIIREEIEGGDVEPLPVVREAHLLDEIAEMVDAPGFHDRAGGCANIRLT